ncbi:hypothetical protein P8452_64350 [Trifolium repens]|nr:hypothetical protein P8452_64350 [Trifolium repens]
MEILVTAMITKKVLVIRAIIGFSQNNKDIFLVSFTIVLRSSLTADFNFLNSAIYSIPALKDQCTYDGDCIRQRMCECY